MKLSGPDKKQLHSALLSAFPKQSNLEQLTTFHLGISLDSVAQGPNLSVVVFRLIEWAESQGRIEDLVNGAKAANPGNVLLKQFAVSAEDERILRAWRVQRRYLIASGLVLALVALGLIRKSSTVVASITTSRAVFAYRPDKLDGSRDDSPLLDRVHARHLDVSSFDAIQINGGQLFREVRKGTWVPVSSSLPLRIKAAGAGARATFTDVWVLRFTVPQFAAVHASAIVTSGVGVEFVVENETDHTKEPSALTIEYKAGNQIDFTCAGCAINSAALDTDRQPQPTQVLRITGVPDKQLLINGRPQRVEIDLIPAGNALGHEQFPIETARFCEGVGNDPQALQSADVTIGETGKEQLPIDRQRSTMVLTPQNSLFVVKGFRVLPRDGARPAAFAIEISGRAKDIRIGPSCKETTSIMPSYLSHFFSQLRIAAF